MFFLLLVKL